MRFKDDSTVSNRGAEAMRLFREAEKITQAQAAQRCGIDQQVWARYERGEAQPGLDNAHKIERGTDEHVRAEWFLEEEPLSTRVASG